MSTKYTIVKYAQDPHWTFHFDIDPKKVGVKESFSAHDSYTGTQINLKARYEDKDLAELACKEANEANPSGGYAVCKIIRH